MTHPQDELHSFAKELEELIAHGHQSLIQETLKQFREAAEEVGKAWSGSWIGYHANVYFARLLPPPPGNFFNPEWGMEVSPDGWKTFAPDKVKEKIWSHAGNPDVDPAKQFNEAARSLFEKHKHNLLSIIEIESIHPTSQFINTQKEALDKLVLVSKHDYILSRKPTQFRSRDSLAAHQGFWIPPHIEVLAEVIPIQNNIRACAKLAEIAKQIASHMSRQQPQSKTTMGTRIFIGHGRSHVWRELKDFLKDKLGLLVDEFNRVPAAGVHVSDRLLAMLNSTGIAFLVMTGEDQQPSGELRARENVVHEAGLFQGRLGFQRAIVLLEDGCDKFSNNAGLGHINFPKGNIRAAFEDVREVLEREGFVNRDTLS